MKSTARIVSVLAVALMIAALPAFGAGGMMGQDQGQGTGGQKDQCLLVAKNCATSDSINVRVDRLQREISKGTSVYTDSELNKLQQDLKEAQRVQKIYNDYYPPSSF